MDTADGYGSFIHLQRSKGSGNPPFLGIWGTWNSLGIFSRDPQGHGKTFPISFPYHSHTSRDSYSVGMRVLLLGVTRISLDSWWIKLPRFNLAARCNTTAIQWHSTAQYCAAMTHVHSTWATKKTRPWHSMKSWLVNRDTLDMAPSL